MLLRCCLFNITITIPRHILYFAYLCPCLGLGVSYLCDLYFIFSLILIVINHITSLKQTRLFCVRFLEYLLIFLDDNLDQENKYYSNTESSASLVQYFADFSLAFLIKKSLYMSQFRCTTRQHTVQSLFSIFTLDVNFHNIRIELQCSDPPIYFFCLFFHLIKEGCTISFNGYCSSFYSKK